MLPLPFQPKIAQFYELECNKSGPLSSSSDDEMGNFGGTAQRRGPFCPALHSFSPPINQIAGFKFICGEQNGSRAGGAE